MQGYTLQFSRLFCMFENVCVKNLEIWQKLPKELMVQFWHEVAPKDSLTPCRWANYMTHENSSKISYHVYLSSDPETLSSLSACFPSILSGHPGPPIPLVIV